jgi:hypothetical protein
MNQEKVLENSVKKLKDAIFCPLYSCSELGYESHESKKAIRRRHLADGSPFTIWREVESTSEAIMIDWVARGDALESVSEPKSTEPREPLSEFQNAICGSSQLGTLSRQQPHERSTQPVSLVKSAVIGEFAKSKAVL